MADSRVGRGEARGKGGCRAGVCGLERHCSGCWASRGSVVGGGGCGGGTCSLGSSTGGLCLLLRPACRAGALLGRV